MAQNKYIAALQIADKVLASQLKEEDAILLASLAEGGHTISCLLYTSPSPRDRTRSRMPSSA